MIHLGDITKIKGNDAPVVDCVIGGSPCQDLSTAGKRQGLSGERSGLYMEQIRIIKEMRQADALHGNTDVDIRPRYMVWENVPGAFSTNQGKDFAAVLEEAIRVAEPEAPSVPVPEKGWSTSGCLLGDKWSIAWRVLDAQFWGVPQRRRRIALVADFGGHSAPEILFVRKSVSGNIEPSQPKRKEATRDASDGSGGASKGIPYTMKIRSGVEVDSQGKKAGKGALLQTDKSGCLNTVQDQYLFQPIPETICIEMTSTKNTIIENGICPTLTARMGTGGNQVNAVLSPKWYEMQGFGQYKDSGVASALKARDYKDATDLVMCIASSSANAEITDGSISPSLLARAGTGGNNVPTIIGINGDKAGTLDASYYKGCGERQGTEREVVCQLSNAKYIVRRLTPLECERLQGFPDGWTDIGEWVDSNGKTRKLSDSARYKALGNSIALPPWKWVLKRLCACYERDATMASLFDGIGGFPLIWEQLNGKGSCLWASEIEEFPIAVTKLRFGDGS